MAAVPSIGRAREIEQQSCAPGARLTERLYERHHDRVLGFCLYQLRDRDDAADAAQTTFLYALRALRRGVIPAFEAPWLIAIARNVCRSRWDSGKRRGEVEFAHDPHRLAEVAPGRESSDELLGLDAALAVLPGPQRQAVLLRDWNGLSYQEVAEQLGITVSSAETLIFRGRQALARALNGDEPREEEASKRRFGLSSLVSALKPGLLGGGAAAKVAAGTAVVALGVSAGDTLLRHDTTPVRTPAPHVSTTARQPGLPLGTPRGTPTAPHAASARLAQAPQRSGVSAGANSGVPTTAPPTPTPPAATGDPAGDPTWAEPTSPVPGAPPAPAPDRTPSGSTPAPDPPDQLVTTMPTIVDPTVDTAQTIVTTVVTTATPVVSAVTDAVQPVVSPVAPTVTVTVPPLPIHLP